MWRVRGDWVKALISVLFAVFVTVLQSQIALPQETAAANGFAPVSDPVGKR